MKTSKFTEEQIAFTLKQAELGTPVKEVIRAGQVFSDSIQHFLSGSPLLLSYCVFRSKPTTKYDLTRPPIMIQADHRL